MVKLKRFWECELPLRLLNACLSHAPITAAGSMRIVKSHVNQLMVKGKKFVLILQKDEFSYFFVILINLQIIISFD
jgi:hypothetical protein